LGITIVHTSIDEYRFAHIGCRFAGKMPWLVTFNVRHYQPGHSDIKIMRLGEIVLQVSELLDN
jgi:hypothetical protein